MKLIVCAFLLSTVLLNNPFFQMTPKKVKNGYRKCEIYQINYNYDTIIPVNSTISKVPPNAHLRLDVNSRHLDATVNYDENGNNLEYISYNDGKTHYRYSYKYNDKGKLIERVYYDSAGVIQFKNSYKDGLNEENCQILYTDATGTLPVKDSIKYYENGNIRQQVYYDSAGLNRFWDRYEYDENGNLIESVDYEASVSNTFRYGYKYDENGYLIEFSFSQKQSYKPQITKYKNDAYGNILKAIYYNGGDEPDSMEEYVYTK